MRDPYSLEAEHGVLGAMMQRPELIDVLADELTRSRSTSQTTLKYSGRSWRYVLPTRRSTS